MDSALPLPLPHPRPGVVMLGGAFRAFRLPAPRGPSRPWGLFKKVRLLRGGDGGSCSQHLGFGPRG